MKICIVGAGAIGGYLGARLALAGEEVTLIARGANLAAIRERGLILDYADGRREVATPALATSDMREAGQQDVVIAAVKAQQLPAIVADMAALYGPNTIVVTAQNGVPWWYFHRHGGHTRAGGSSRSTQAARSRRYLPVERVIGCVVYPAAELAAPGVVRHIEGDRFTIGELDGAKTERIQQLSKVLSGAGLKAPVRPRIRAEIWSQAVGQYGLQPDQRPDPRGARCDLPLWADARATRAMMAEGQAVAERLGIEFRSRSSSASPAPSRSARIRPRCSRISRQVDCNRDRRAESARWPSWAAWSTSQRRISTRSMPASSCWS